MIHTIKHRKKLNAQYLLYHQPDGYKLKYFASSERLLLDRPPIYAVKLSDARHAEALAARYWLDYRWPMPVLVHVTTDARTGHQAYDVNYVNPNNPHDIELVAHYLEHTEVYASCSFGSEFNDNLVKCIRDYPYQVIDNFMSIDIDKPTYPFECYAGIFNINKS